MSTQQNDLPYFRLRLQEHLNGSFPEKANDQKFIEQRSSWAANAYEGAFLSDNAIDWNKLWLNVFEKMYFLLLVLKSCFEYIFFQFAKFLYNYRNYLFIGS